MPHPRDLLLAAASMMAGADADGRPVWDRREALAQALLMATSLYGPPCERPLFLTGPRTYARGADLCARCDWPRSLHHAQAPE